MKTITFLLLLAMALLSACNKGNKIPARTLTGTEWEVMAGMIPPAGAKLISQSRAEEVDVYGITSESPISMPFYRAPGVNAYLALPIENATAYVEKVLGVQIDGAREAISSKWEAGRHLYQGTIVRASDRDYMVIEKYPK